MLSVTVPNRPFATESITGMMMPDGFFESSLGQQRLNAHFRHTGVAPLTNASINIESASHPSIQITPQTHFIPQLSGGGARLLGWDVDVGGTPPGTYFVSFVVESGGTRDRIIKKIFVTQVTYDPASEALTIHAPEGRLEATIRSGLGPKDRFCCAKIPDDVKGNRERLRQLNFVNDLDQLVDALPGGNLEVCLPLYLPTELSVVVRHNPPFSGQYSDLPYQDPWWKDLLLILLIIFLLAIIVTIIVAGVVSVVITGGATGPLVVVTFECCTGPTALLLVGLLVAAAGSGVAAGASDERDPFRRGQDNTMPAAGELTVAERLEIAFNYTEPVALGRPFSVDTKWDYTRITDGGTTYNFGVQETNQNVHVLARIEVEANDVVHSYKKEDWIIRARFFGPDDKMFKADQMFVRCILEGTGQQEGRYLSLTMQDDGIAPDLEPADGWYTGHQLFTEKERGLWKLYVVAQDVNTAQPNMAPEEAAKIIGGMVRTHQLTIDFAGGTCPLVPDGHVNVL
jgi:hypothetical protein